MTSPALAERYGVDRPWRRRIIVGTLSVVVAAFAAWLVWTVGDQVSPEVSSQLQSFDIVDEHTASAVLVVSLRDPDVRATCRLRAYAEDHTVVGELSFRPDPGSRRQTQEIRTERRATSVESMACTAPGQDRPR